MIKADRLYSLAFGLWKCLWLPCYDHYAPLMAFWWQCLTEDGIRTSFKMLLIGNLHFIFLEYQMLHTHLSWIGACKHITGGLFSSGTSAGPLNLQYSVVCCSQNNSSGCGSVAYVHKWFQGSIWALLIKQRFSSFLLTLPWDLACLAQCAWFCVLEIKQNRKSFTSTDLFLCSFGISLSTYK